MRPGVRIVNAARGELVDTVALAEALDSGHVAGAALDVFESEPITESPLFGRSDVVVTPHLGASTAEAQDRAGTIIAEQVVRALTGEMCENAVNVPDVSLDDRAALAAYIPLAEKLGRVAVALADGGIERIEITCAGGIGQRDTRLLTLAVLRGALRGMAEERGQPRERAGAGPGARHRRARAAPRGRRLHEPRSASPRPTTPRWPARCSAPTTARGSCVRAATRSRSSSPG